MRLLHVSEDNDCNHSLYSATNGTNHNVPDQQTFTPQLLPSVESLDDDQQDADYLSLATGHATGNHNVTTNIITSAPTSLIDQVIASPEQTYEHLLASFTYLTAADLLQAHTMQSNSVACQSVSESVLPQMSSFSVCGQQEPASMSLTFTNVDEEDTIEELVLKEVSQSERYPFGFGRRLQVDNFLTTDKEAYNTMSESDVDYDDVGTLPQYSVFDASFLSEGRSRDIVGTFAERHAMHSYDDADSRRDCRSLSSSDVVQTEISSDVVEPFFLDPDFDYDNVQLSAKFTNQDLVSSSS